MTQKLPAIEMLDRYVVDRRRGTPLHAQIEQALRKTIAQHFENGDIFFKETEIATRLGVARATVRQALGEISRDGLLQRRPGTNTIVTKSPTDGVRVQASHVGVFVAEYDSEYISMVLQKIMEECRRRDLTVHTYYTHKGDNVRQAYSRISRSPAEERFVAFADLEILEALSDGGYRAVSLETPSHDYPGLFVETDARMAIQMGVDYLRSLGHQRITLLVNEPANLASVEDKIAQFRQALPSGRVVLCGTRLWENSYQAAYAHMEDVWGVPERPTAVMTASDPGAWAALRWFSERGIAMPGEVSVLGFEDARSSRFLHPSLSTIAHPVEALARTAIEMLWDEREGPRGRCLPPDLVIRESTGPVPETAEMSAAD